MTELVTIDRELAIGRIADACACLSEVAAAFLFGSALGPCRPDSDIDVGVIRRDRADESDDARFHARLRLEYDVMSRLGSLDGHLFDVTVLDGDQPLFAMTVLTEGLLCYVGDLPTYTDFLEHVGQGYRENAPRYEQALREAREDSIFR